LHCGGRDRAGCAIPRANRRLKQADVPGFAKLAGLAGAVIGFFVIPFVGLFFGLSVGIFVAEQVRLRDWGRARIATKAAIRAVRNEHRDRAGDSCDRLVDLDGRSDSQLGGAPRPSTTSPGRDDGPNAPRDVA
jgi:hypothetical protein